MDVRQLLHLKGRVALVSGGYGIFEAPTSEALAEAGAHVVIASGIRHRTREAAHAGGSTNGSLLNDLVFAMPSCDGKEASR
jgi:NAD(P)-dependent dehydrogenase (short-subunit alcohol dehydrogenase family)